MLPPPPPTIAPLPVSYGELAAIINDEIELFRGDCACMLFDIDTLPISMLKYQHKVGARLMHICVDLVWLAVLQGKARLISLSSDYTPISQTSSYAIVERCQRMLDCISGKGQSNYFSEQTYPSSPAAASQFSALTTENDNDNDGFDDTSSIGSLSTAHNYLQQMNQVGNPISWEDIGVDGNTSTENALLFRDLCMNPKSSSSFMDSQRDVIDWSRLCEDEHRLYIIQLLSWMEGNILACM